MIQIRQLSRNSISVQIWFVHGSTVSSLSLHNIYWIHTTHKMCTCCSLAMFSPYLSAWSDCWGHSLLDHGTQTLFRCRLTMLNNISFFDLYHITHLVINKVSWHVYFWFIVALPFSFEPCFIRVGQEEGEDEEDGSICCICREEAAKAKILKLQSYWVIRSQWEE